MPFSTSISHFNEFVQLTVVGPADIANFVQLVGDVEAETVYWSEKRVLCDLTAVDGELTPEEQIFLGELVAQSLPHLERMASVVPPERITRNSENAAQGKGVQLKVFTSRTEAMAWLSAPVLSNT